MGLKLGPSLKIVHHIEQLKKSSSHWDSNVRERCSCLFVCLFSILGDCPRFFALRWEEMRVFFYLNSALFPFPCPPTEQWMMSVQIFRRHSTEISSRGQTEEPNGVVHVRLTYLLLLFFFPLMILVVLFVVVAVLVVFLFRSFFDDFLEVRLSRTCQWTKLLNLSLTRCESVCFIFLLSLYLYLYAYWSFDGDLVRSIVGSHCECWRWRSFSFSVSLSLYICLYVFSKSKQMMGKQDLRWI